jgi:hypothetical protein
MKETNISHDLQHQQIQQNEFLKNFNIAME